MRRTDDEKICTGHTLADAVSRSKLPADEAKAWRRDLQSARKTLKVPAKRVATFSERHSSRILGIRVIVPK